MKKKEWLESTCTGLYFLDRSKKVNGVYPCTLNPKCNPPADGGEGGKHRCGRIKRCDEAELTKSLGRKRK